MVLRWFKPLAYLFTAALAAASGSIVADEHGAASSLTGQLLVATSKMPDPRFAHAVIYLVSHDRDGAMGLVINRSYGKGPLRSLLEGFGVEKAKPDETITLHYGGPVEQIRGFVLHSADYAGPSTRRVSGNVALSTGFDILKALATGGGPRQKMFLLGYAGWGPGQLEGEIARDDWLTAPADERLIFSDDTDEVWREALKHAGTPL